MIPTQAYLTIKDNTNVKKIMCIRILGHSLKYGTIGDIIIGVVKDVIPNKNIKKSEIVRALIISTKKKFNRQNTLYLQCNQNLAILINKENNPRGTRIFGPLPYELRIKKFTKIFTLAQFII